MRRHANEHTWASGGQSLAPNKHIKICSLAACRPGERLLPSSRQGRCHRSRESWASAEEPEALHMDPYWFSGGFHPMGFPGE